MNQDSYRPHEMAIDRRNQRDGNLVRAGSSKIGYVHDMNQPDVELNECFDIRVVPDRAARAQGKFSRRYSARGFFGLWQVRRAASRSPWAGSDDCLCIRNGQRSGSALRSSALIDADARLVFAEFNCTRRGVFPGTSRRDRHCRRRTELAQRSTSSPLRANLSVARAIPDSRPDARAWQISTGFAEMAHDGVRVAKRSLRCALSHP